MPAVFVAALVVALVVAYSWWVVGLAPFSGSMLVAVEAAGGAALVAGWWRRRSGLDEVGETEHRSRRASWPGVGVWLVLVAALVGWELASYVQHPRGEHPTISHMLNIALDARPVRAAAFAVWVSGAYWLGRR